MTDLILLDSGPLGMLCHYKLHDLVEAWLAEMSASERVVVIPELADYEVRRELLRTKAIKGIRRLDRFKLSLAFLPISSTAMLLAAEIWASMRSRGLPTAANNRLDGDAILAGQAESCRNKGIDVVVATDNVKHLREMTAVVDWKDLVG